MSYLVTNTNVAYKQENKKRKTWQQIRIMCIKLNFKLCFNPNNSKIIYYSKLCTVQQRQQWLLMYETRGRIVQK